MQIKKSFKNEVAKKMVDVINIDEKERALCLAKYLIAFYKAGTERDETKMSEIAIKMWQLLLKIPKLEQAQKIAKPLVKVIANYEKEMDFKIIGKKELSEAYHEESQENLREHLLAIKNYDVENN